MNEIEQCEKELSKYLSLFETRHFIERKAFVERCLRKIKDESEFGYEEDIEYCWAKNIISFFAIILKDNAAAKGNIDKALEKNENDMIALVNKGWFYHKSGDISECLEVCKRLKELKFTDVDYIYAKAQIAYLYSRLGMAAYPKSVEYFTEVLEKVEEVNNVPDSHNVLWNFGLGLTRKRLLHIPNVLQIDDGLLSEKKYEEALKPYLNNMSRIKTTSVYRARSIVSIAELVYSLEKIGGSLFERLKERLKLNSSMDYFKEALKIGSQDHYVLERCGKQFRYTQDIRQSIECLKNALDKQKTSFAHHHLALSLKRELEMELQKETKSILHISAKRLPQGMTASVKQKYQLNPPEYSGTLSRDTKPKQGSWSDNKKRLMKSPRHVLPLDFDKAKKILHHLDEAVKMDSNLPALYEKGLVYRSINQLDNARKTFEDVKNYPDISPVMLTNAYEQSAYCLLDRPEKSGKDKDNARIYLKKAMEIQCNEIVNKNPDLNEAWCGVPTLKDLLSGEFMSKQTLRDLVYLNEMIKEYEAATELCFQLNEINIDANENFETNMKIVKLYMKQNNIPEAILNMNMMRLLPEWSEKMDIDLFIQVQISGGIDSYLSGDKMLARKRFETAIRRGKDLKKHESQFDSKENDKTDSFDFLILSNSFETRGVTVNLLNLLKTVGINATANDDDVIIGTTLLSTMEKIIKGCECFIVVCDSSEEPPSEFIWSLDFIERGIQGGGQNQIVVVKTSESSELQMTLHKYPSIMACNIIKQRDTDHHFDPETITWIKELLLKMLCRNDTL